MESYYRARYYNPAVGRFISEDPVRFDGGINFYRYATNSPTQFTDPSGLFETKFHWDMTYQLALAIFGSKCADRAKAVADANAEVDKISGVSGYLQFGLFMGEGWKNGGPHFPSPDLIATTAQHAVETCSSRELGRATHMIQDKWAHGGATPLLHYLTMQAIDIEAAQDPGTVDHAMQETIIWLTEFKKNCLNCCK